MEFYDIYRRLNGSLFSEAVLSVDSNRDVTSRGNSHNDKTLTDPNTRDKILQARVQEIEAFAKNRGIDPLKVLGAAEVALRTGRIPNLSMYGLGGDDMVATKHFIAGEILNLAGMEAVNWDGTPLHEEELPKLTRDQAYQLNGHIKSVARRLADMVRRHHRDQPDARHVAQETSSLLGHVMMGGKPEEFAPQRGGRHAQDYHHAAHRVFNAPGQQDAVMRTLRDVDFGEDHAAIKPHIERAYDRMVSFVATPPSPKADHGGEKSALGAPTEFERRGKHASGKQGGIPGEYGAKRKGGSVGGPAPRGKRPQVEWSGTSMPADRNASATSGTLTGYSLRAINTPPERGKEQIQGDLDKSTIANIKKGMANVKSGEKTKVKTGPETRLTGLQDYEVKNLGRELGALNTGESVEDDERRILGIDRDDPRNEAWPKIGAELKKLLNLESAFCFRSNIEEGNPLARDVAHKAAGLHRVIISAYRKELPHHVNKKRQQDLHKALTDAGYSFKHARGEWQNPSGEKEHEASVVVHAKRPGDDAGKELIDFAAKLMDNYKQDAFIHYHPSGEGRAFKKDGSTETYGTTRYNTDNPYGETQFKPRAPKSVRPKFTFM